MKQSFIKEVSFPKVVIGNLQKLFIVKKHTAKNGGRAPSPADGSFGDDSLIYQNGFTLIELLVVVLIIGILAAVALPQYQTAVDKSRYSAMLFAVRGLHMAQMEYYMANGIFASSLADLEGSLPAQCVLSDNGYTASCKILIYKFLEMRLSGC